MATREYYVTPNTYTVNATLNPSTGKPSTTVLGIYTYVPKAEGLFLGGKYVYNIYLSSNNNSSISGDLKLNDDAIPENDLRNPNGSAGSYDITIPAAGSSKFRTFIDSYCSPTGKIGYIKVVGTHTGSNIIYHNLETIYYSTPAITFKCETMKPSLPAGNVTITKHWTDTNRSSETPSYLLNKNLTYITVQVSKPSGNDYWTAQSVKISGITLASGNSTNAFTGTGNKANYTCAPFKSSGTVKITFTITSSAGYTNITTVDVSVYQHVPPKLVIDTNNPPTSVTKYTLTENGNDVDYCTVQFKASIRPGCRQVSLRSGMISSAKISTGNQVGTIVNCTLPSPNQTVTFSGGSGGMYLIDMGRGSGNPAGRTTINGTTYDGAVFIDGNNNQRGVKPYESVELSFTVIDDAGISTELKYNFGVIKTAFHLKVNGDGAKFGGTATRALTLESDWKLLVNSDIEASGNIKGNSLEIATQGTLKLPDLNNKSSIVTVAGIGKTPEPANYATTDNYSNPNAEASVAHGIHWHGAIDAYGYMPNYTPVVDGRRAYLMLTNNRRVQAQVIPTDDLPMGANTDVTEITSRANSSIGTSAKGLCYADHGHKVVVTADQYGSGSGNANAFALKRYVDHEIDRCFAAIDAVII